MSIFSELVRYGIIATLIIIGLCFASFNKGRTAGYDEGWKAGIQDNRQMHCPEKRRIHWYAPQQKRRLVI